MFSTDTELRTYYFIFLLLSLFLCSSTVYASENEDMVHYQGKLEKLQKSIAKIQQHLKGSKRQRSHVLTELKELESEISKNALLLNSLAKDVQKTQKQKIKLERDLQQLNKQLNRQQTILSEQMRSAYSMGHQQNLKMLLNQQNPAQAGRAQEYFNYFNRARTQQIDSFTENIKRKGRTESKLKQTLSKQKALLQTQKKKKRKRQKQRLQRKNLLAELSSKIKNQETTLSSL